jgi:hypothetical protein
MSDKKASPAQIQVIQTIISTRNLRDMKDDIINNASNGATTSVSELTIDQARSLITAFNSQNIAPVDTDAEKKQKMCNKIIAMAHQLGWIEKTAYVEKGKLVEKNDYTKLNNWMIEYSYLHKEMRKYSLKELMMLVSQFEDVFKYYLKKQS